MKFSRGRRRRLWDWAQWKSGSCFLGSKLLRPDEKRRCTHQTWWQAIKLADLRSPKVLEISEPVTSSVNSVLKPRITHHDRGRAWLRSTCMLGTWQIGSVDASWLMIHSFLQPLFEACPEQLSQELFGLLFGMFLWGSLVLQSKIGFFGSWYGNLPGSWTLQGAAGHLRSLRPCRQTPRFGVASHVCLKCQDLKVFKAWNAVRTSVEPRN